MPPAPSKPVPAADLHDRVAAVIDALRPVIQADGGDVEFVGVTDDNVAQVRLKGACIGCPSAAMTLRHGIERSVRENAPEITGIEALEP